MGAFAWPTATTIIAIVFLVMFREQISGLIARIKRLSRTGIEADAQLQVSPSEACASAAEELLRESDSPLIADQEQILQAELDKRTFATEQDRARYLLRQLTISVVLRSFEATYNLIYGSQVFALQQLNSREDMAVDDFKPIYEFAAGAYHTLYEGYSFENWFGFISASSLVVVHGDSVRISVRGREFLRYLVSAGRPAKNG